MHTAYAKGSRSVTSDAREVRLFRNNRNQAIRIPVEFERPGDRAIGEERIDSK